MGGMEGMLVGLLPAVGVLARIPERKGEGKGSKDGRGFLSEGS